MYGLLTPVITPRYNIAPTQSVPVIIKEAGNVMAQNMVWGLIPYWAKDRKIGGRSINARAETVACKPTFREPFKRRRCLVPASGFYEWKKGPDRSRKPYYFAAADPERPLIFAGLWDEWKGEAETIRSFTVVTTAADQHMAAFHDRMPVILAPAQWEPWLSTDTLPDPSILTGGSVPLEFWPVDGYVNKAGNEGMQCIESLA
jgi:Uncharacterized conserved protein